MPARPLEPAGDALRALLDAVADRAVRTVDALPDAPASAFDGVDDVVADPALRRPPPETGRPLAELLQVLDRAAGRRAQPVRRPATSPSSPAAGWSARRWPG